MLTRIQYISVFCFAASYVVAFGLEAWHLWRPRPILRVLSLAFGAAGLFAHVAFLIWQTLVTPTLTLSSPTGSLLFLAMILAIFYLYGAIHHRRIAWALFVLPVVLGLIGLGRLSLGEANPEAASEHWHRFWGIAHGILLIFAAVGVSVGFIASVMYLVQLRRLQAKLPPGQGMSMLSLERLEEMNRHAILWSFPLLTMGLLAGFALQARLSDSLEINVRTLSLVGLWIVFAILFFLRYRVHVRGRQLALWTMFAFAILILALVSPHVQGGGAP